MQSNYYNFSICVVIHYYIFIIILTQINKTYSTCAQTQCNVSQCISPNNCVHGITDDECHCCKVCLRQVGETCGKQIGKCVEGLQCLNSELLDPVMTNLVITGKELGICVLNCTGVRCNNGSGVSPVTDNIKCPNDSYKLSSNGSNSCCPLSCACLPGICNSRIKCPFNKIPRIVRPGNWRPGSCCDLIECIDAPTHCVHNNNKYLNGDQWKHDKCTTCVCKDGLTFCHKKQCKIVNNCNAMAVINDECCPTCQGCISSNGMFYNNTQNWYEDECTHCECNNGEKSCRVEMCQPVSCDKPVVIEGQCCPVCQTHECDLHCLQGYKKDSSGKELCECNKCLNKQHECLLLCPQGFKKVEDGCEICECETVAFDQNVIFEDMSINQIENKVCILTNGTIFENGQYWNDGCRECICNNGKTMCTTPECPPIKCFNAIIIDYQCCPTCSVQELKTTDTVQSTGIIQSSHLNSHLFITAIILALIITILLLGIFILLAIVIVKKIPYNKYIRSNRIESMKENAIIHFWQNNQSPKMQLQEKQLVRIDVGNKAEKEGSQQIEQLKTIQHKLTTRPLSCPDSYTLNINN